MSRTISPHDPVCLLAANRTDLLPVRKGGLAGRACTGPAGSFFWGVNVSLERKDIRAKLCPDKHAELQIIAECDGRDMGEIVEEVICAWIKQRVDAATLLTDRLARLGKPGNNREFPGKTGNGRD